MGTCGAEHLIELKEILKTSSETHCLCHLNPIDGGTFDCRFRSVRAGVASADPGRSPIRLN